MSESLPPLDKTFVVIFALIIGACAFGYLIQSYAFLAEPTKPADITTSDYTGKVIQVDHITINSGGFLFSSSRTDTYVTFDNKQTYWKSGYQVIIEGNTYQVHSVKTIKYGPQAGGNGTLTTVENTFTVIP